MALIEAGADPFMETKELGLTAFGYACANSAKDRDSTRIVKKMIEMGADVNKADGRGWTPLMKAARMMRKFRVGSLLVAERGDDFDVGIV